jgi:hypothetical protein
METLFEDLPEVRRQSGTAWFIRSSFFWRILSVATYTGTENELATIKLGTLNL